MSARLEDPVADGLPRPIRNVPTALSDLVALAGATAVQPGWTTVSVAGVTHTAHQVRPGDMFAALPGGKMHGADFTADAIARGAVAVLTDSAGATKIANIDSEFPVLVTEQPREVLGCVAAHIYGNPSTKLAVWGVTGTSGRTTTTHFIESVLRAAGRTTGIIGTNGTRIADETVKSPLTSPEAPDLQALLAVMVERGISDVAVEVSSHALRMGRVNGVQFAVAAFTNLSQDHLDFHRDMEDYFQAKATLFDGRAKTQVICVDDGWGRRLATDYAPQAITVSASKADAVWTARKMANNATSAQSFHAVGPAETDLPIQLNVPGSFNVTNALIATAGLHAQGIAHSAIQIGLAQAGVPGRMQSVDLGQGFTAIVDYAHKPAAVELALDALKNQAPGKIIVVLGCGGDRDRAKRSLMGAAAARRSGLLVITDDNPRSEDPAAIRAQMWQGALAVPESERGEVVEIGDRRAAVEFAVAAAKPGDVVVIAGKGHETGQEVAGVIHPFSDVDVLTAAIRSMQA